MAKTAYSNCIGTFVFENQDLVEEKLFSSNEMLSCNRSIEKNEILETEKQFLQKYPDAKLHEKNKPVPYFVLEFLSNEKYLEKIRAASMIVTKRSIADSLRNDHLIIQAINNIDEIDKVSNNLSKRLREWYELYNPEFSRSIESHEKFAEIIQQRTKDQLLNEIGISEQESMGAEFTEADLRPVMNLSNEITSLYRLRAQQVDYVEQEMQKILPNVTCVAGHMIGARLLAIAGSLEKLSLFPASTIQLLGAEKALFRHIKTGAKPPKFGLIINHPLVARAEKQNKGKAARMVADKISIAAKIDFFKGEFRGEFLRTELEKRLGK